MNPPVTISRASVELRCAKCGSADIYTKYVAMGEVSSWEERRRWNWPDYSPDEYLQRNCRGCTFAWRDPILAPADLALSPATTAYEAPRDPCQRHDTIRQLLPKSLNLWVCVTCGHVCDGERRAVYPRTLGTVGTQAATAPAPPPVDDRRVVGHAYAPIVAGKCGVCGCGPTANDHYVKPAPVDRTKPPVATSDPKRPVAEPDGGEGKDGELTTAAPDVNKAANQIVMAVRDELGAEFDDPEDYASVRGEVEGIIERLIGARARRARGE